MVQIVSSMNKLKRRAKPVDCGWRRQCEWWWWQGSIYIYNNACNSLDIILLTCCLNKVSYSSHSNSNYIKRCLFMINLAFFAFCIPLPGRIANQHANRACALEFVRSWDEEMFDDSFEFVEKILTIFWPT